MSDEIDVIRISVPLFVRLLEFAREDSLSDLDLHFVAENALRLGIQSGETLTMNNYNDLVAKV